MIPRAIQAEFEVCRREAPVVAVTGPRQSGKTTLARTSCPNRPYVSFEDPLVRERFREDPKGLLHDCRDGAVFDEAQRVPELFSFLQGMVDERPEPGRFVVTGSQNFGLVEQITQSLAGRVALLELLPFAAAELESGGWLGADLDTALFAGGFPPVFDRGLRPGRWYADYVATYLERDVRQITQVHDLGTFTRFLRLCAGSVGQLFNASRIGADCGVDHKTIRKWVSVLEASYVGFLVPPYHANVRKRVIKTPKLYLCDTGLACHLLGIQEPAQLAAHPLRGALFENWVFAEILKHLRNRGSRQPVYFWRTHGGQEVDFLVEDAGGLIGVEVKSGMSVRPEAGRLLTDVLQEWDGRPRRGTIVYGGAETATLAGCRLLPWRSVGRLWENQ
jgi:predicted AAA+ superfamily ATPase